MRRQFNAIALAGLLTATAAMAQPTQQPPARNNSATVKPPAAEQTAEGAKHRDRENGRLGAQLMARADTMKRPDAPSPPSASGFPGMALLGGSIFFDGTVTSGAGVTGASRLALGAYEVDFNRDVSGCFYSAAPINDAVLAALEPRGGVANGVFVSFQRFDGSQVAKDSGFYVTVFCAR